MIPIALPGLSNHISNNNSVVAADIGGTKTYLARYEFKNGEYDLVKIAHYGSREYQGVEEMLTEFQDEDPLPDTISMGIAGPVIDQTVHLTNLGWTINCVDLEQKLGTATVLMLNDLEATAYGLAALKEDEFHPVFPGGSEETGNAAILAPGTGLGEAGLYWDGEYLHPFATEGGHVDFSPRSELDIDFLKYLQGKYGHVSWERILSGPGLFNIYQFLKEVKKRGVPAAVDERIEQGDAPGIISEESANGCEICRETIDLFTKYLAVESASLALKYKATGGIFIGGGILPKLLDQFDKEKFIDHFLQVGRLRTLLENVPIKVILNDRTALLGAAYYGAYHQ